MQVLITVLRAAHCRSVHHFFALDALQEVRTESGRQLSRMLLAHFSEYLQGAKDPDDAFKDFQNHVLHVRDGFWGGAAKAAAKWYAEALEHLDAGRWSDAAYAIGVLSHYYTDPWMPLHTGQSSKETVVHRAMEWSICCAYDEVLDFALVDQSVSSFDLPDTEFWLKDAIHASALLSNRYYDDLIDSYDMTEARVQPKLALGITSKKILAQLFTWAISGWAAVLDRLSFESPARVPSFSLTWPALLATIKIPSARIIKVVSDTRQMREVEAILQEYLATGTVKRSLPEELVALAKARIRYPELLPSNREIAAAHAIVVESNNHSLVESGQLSGLQGGVQGTVLPVTTSNSESASSSSNAPLGVSRKSRNLQPLVKVPNHEPRRKRLELEDPIVNAPAIGPKTAVRLQTLGIQTVRQLLESDSEELASRLKVSWIVPQTIEQWKVQARLVHEIAGLTAAGSGLLYLAGITTAEDFLKQSVDELHRLVVLASETSEGQRVLRDKAPPSKDILNKWRHRIHAGEQ